MNKIRITGNSHTIALNQGLSQVPEAQNFEIFGLGPGVHETTPFSTVENGKLRLTHSVYADNLKHFTGMDHFDPNSLWGLCLGTHNSRIYGHRCWLDMAAPSALAGPGVQPVSTAMMRRIIQEDQRHIRAFLTQAREAGLKFFVISAPPPRAGHQNIIRGADAEILLTIDRQARAEFRMFLDSLSAPFIDYPAETADAQGLLRPDYAAGPLKNGKRDPHHGNAAYGALMLQKIVETLAVPA